MSDNIKLYNRYIYDRSFDLIRSKPIHKWDNYDISKIFEYFTCIRLTERNSKQFYEYDDIHPSFKEVNRMSRQDTGIDASDLDKTIVQCKLRTNNLSFKECSTFFASQNITYKETKKTIIRWENLIISRNSESKLSENLQFNKDNDRFEDITFEKKEILDYCQYLLENPPKYDMKENNFIELRDYQLEAIDVIQKNKNSIICIPTGCGKNVIIIHSIEEKKKYLILVPRIILMEQLKDEITRFRPNLKNKIQCIDDSSKNGDIEKDIVICVFNSIGSIDIPFSNFEKIYVDEAHHINLPEIYVNVDQDDSTDEDETYIETNTETYIDKIAKLKEYDNNVYLSATIDDINGFAMYKKEIREMIELEYISDYQIHIPIFANDPSDTVVCKHLIQNYRNIIIYCSSQNDGKRINEIMNQIMKSCSEYIDCNTNKKKRKDIIRKYKEGEIPFLVNVRILVEGFDAPITKGVCFMHLPSNQTTLIQIIGRALRKHCAKTFANIILPFSKDEDENSINQFLKIMSINDSRIKKSFSEKTLGGYVSIEKVNENEESEINENELELKFNFIFDNMGKCLNGLEYWTSKLEKVKKYIDDNEKKPSKTTDNKEIKSLSYWIDDQVSNYKKKVGLMKNEEICKKWEEFIKDSKYIEYFVEDEDKWNSNLEKVKEYIDSNKKRPSSGDKYKEIKSLGIWVSNYNQNYKNKSGLMKNEEIYKKWEEFIHDPKYLEYLMSDEDKWNSNLEKVKEYIDSNNKRPSSTDKNNEIKSLGSWIIVQLTNYKKKSRIMKNEEIRKKWEEFIHDPKYIEYFMSDENIWNSNLEKVKKYIDDNNKRPSSKDKNKEIKSLGYWIEDQVSNYKKKSTIMKNEEIRKKWEEFIHDPKYIEYFMSDENIWNSNLEKVKKYIDDNNKRPSSKDKNKEVNYLGRWIVLQVRNYKKIGLMKNEEICKKWDDFIKDPKYVEYL